MNKSVKSAPITLIIADSAPAVRTALQSLIDNDPEISFAHEDGKEGWSGEVVFRGVSFAVTINEHSAPLQNLKSVFCNLNAGQIGCDIDILLGEHVAGGERVPAIIQGLLGFASKLGAASHAAAVVWHPAKIMSGFSYFVEAVADYLNGGAFPVLAMVNFKAADDGLINSTGLAFLAGQELQAISDGLGEQEMMRRIVRVVHDVAVNGPVNEPVKLGGIEPDEIIQLQPLPDMGRLLMKVCSTLDA